MIWFVFLDNGMKILFTFKKVDGLALLQENHKFACPPGFLQVLKFPPQSRFMEIHLTPQINGRHECECELFVTISILPQSLLGNAPDPHAPEKCSVVEDE